MAFSVAARAALRTADGPSGAITGRAESAGHALSGKMVTRRDDGWLSPQRT
jgi:hypothetical protein